MPDEGHHRSRLHTLAFSCRDGAHAVHSSGQQAPAPNLHSAQLIARVASTSFPSPPAPVVAASLAVWAVEGLATAKGGRAEPRPPSDPSRQVRPRGGVGGPPDDQRNGRGEPWRALALGPLPKAAPHPFGAAAIRNRIAADAARHPAAQGPAAAGAPAPAELAFGWVPAEVVRSLLEDVGDFRARGAAIELLHATVLGVGGAVDAAAARATLSAFLAFLLRLVADHNFRVAAAAMAVLGDLAVRLGPDLAPYLGGLAAALAERMGDSVQVPSRRRPLALRCAARCRAAGVLLAQSARCPLALHRLSVLLRRERLRRSPSRWALQRCWRPSAARWCTSSGGCGRRASTPTSPRY